MPDLRLATDRAYGPSPRQLFDVIAPDGADGCPTVLMVHGGWFAGGHHHDLRPFAIALAEKGYACAPMTLRHLADVRSGADLVDDVCVAAGKALEEATLLDASPRSLVVLGSGSGSLPALVAAQRLAENRSLRVRAAIACGVTPASEPWDGCPAHLLRVLAQYGGHQHHLLSPLALPADRFPPLLLVHGDEDQEVSAKLAHKLHLRVIEAGEESQLAVLTGLGHQIIEQPGAGARTALERIVAFLADHVREPEAEPPYVGGRD